MISYWLVVDGVIDNMKYIPQAKMDGRMFVGDVKNPVAIIKRREVYDYLDGKFNQLYDIWKKYHIGMGFPNGLPWTEQPEVIIGYIETLEILERNRIGR